MGELVYVNGRLLPRDEARVSAVDRGFLYGDGLFETMRIGAGRALHLDEHLNRLASGVAFLGIPCPPLGELREAVAATVAANEVEEGSLRLTLTGGEGSGPDPVFGTRPTLVVSAKSGIPYRAEQYLAGFRAHVVSLRRDQSSPLCRVKSLNYLPNLLARREAREAGCDEGLFLNLEGNLSEGTVSNLFLWEKGHSPFGREPAWRLITPGEGSGLLPGIMRRAVMEVARRAGYDVLEEEVPLTRLLKSDEAFLTNSLMQIMPLVAVGGRSMGTGRPGPLTRQLMELYRENLAPDPL